MMVAPRLTWRRLEWTRPGDAHVEASKAGRDDENTTGTSGNVHGSGINEEHRRRNDMPTGKWGAAAVLSHRKNCVILTGGCASRTTREPSDDVWSLDLATLRWRRHAEETSASSGVADEEGDASDMRWCAPFGGSGRAFHSAVCFETPAPVSAEDAVGGGGGGGPVTDDAVSDLIFIFGGRTSGGALTSSLHMIDAKDMRWMSLSEIVRGDFPSPREGHAAVRLHSGSMLVYGGYNNDIWLNDMYVLDIDVLTWRRLDMYDEGSALAKSPLTALENGKNSVTDAGGIVFDIDNNGSLRSVRKVGTTRASAPAVTDVDQEDTNNIKTMYRGATDAPMRISGHSMTLIDWRVVSVGGTNCDSVSGAGHGEANLHIWDTISGVWERIAVPPASAPRVAQMAETTGRLARDLGTSTIPSMHGVSLMRTPGVGNILVVHGGVYGGPWESPDARVYSSRLRAFTVSGVNASVRELPLDIISEDCSGSSLSGEGIPDARSGHCMVSISPTTALLFGGWNGTSIKQDVWVLSSRTGEDGEDEQEDEYDYTTTTTTAAAGNDMSGARAYAEAPLASATKSALWDRNLDGGVASNAHIVDVIKNSRIEDGVPIENLHPNLLFGADRSGRLAEDRLRHEFVQEILSSLQTTISGHEEGIARTRESLLGKLGWLEDQRRRLQQEVDAFGEVVGECTQQKEAIANDVEAMKKKFDENDKHYSSLSGGTFTIDDNGADDELAKNKMLELLDRVERLARMSS